MILLQPIIQDSQHHPQPRVASAPSREDVQVGMDVVVLENRLKSDGQPGVTLEDSCCLITAGISSVYVSAGHWEGQCQRSGRDPAPLLSPGRHFWGAVSSSGISGHGAPGSQIEEEIGASLTKKG